MKLKSHLLVALIFLTCLCYAQIPILNSNPTITNKVVYLDFDGQVVSGTLWNSGNPVFASPSTASNANIIVIWKRITEDYKPFDVNITTDSLRFKNAPANQRIRVIFTPTSAWYGSAGGVAYVGSFNWGGTPGTPCWVFENQLNYNARSMAEAASHEAGHTFTLRHQSSYDNQCVKTAEYNAGTGSGVTSWAPIMGVGYTKNVTIWHTGKSSTGCNTIQNDHGNTGVGITSPGYLNFIQDDVGNVFNTAKILNLNSLNLSDSGIISQPTDVDAFRFTICNNRYVSINVKPWALDTINYSGADLDVKLKLFNAANNLLVADSTITKLTGLVGLNLTPGSYYFTIDGGPSANYSDYGSIGRYYISIKATNPPAMVSSINTSGNICSGQNTPLNYISNGTPTAWNWTVSGANTTTYITQNPSTNFSPAGIYTISLLATNPSSLSCVNTVTLNIGNIPAINITGPSSSVCPQTIIPLSVSGASSYTWLPGNFVGSSQNISPNINTTYTVIGSNGTCSNSAIKTVSLSPPFTVNINLSSTLICSGQSVTLTATGANSYTITPGNIISNTAILSPTFNTMYNVVGAVGSCNKFANKLINVDPPFIIYYSATDTIPCISHTISLNAWGANSFTYNPGGLVGNQVVVSPTVPTTFTISGINGNKCISDTTLLIRPIDCNLVGLANNVQVESQTLIYPNPTQNKFTIETSHSLAEVEVLDFLGKKVFISYAVNKNATQIDASNWPRGIYFIKLTYASEKQTVHKLHVE